MAKKKTRKPSGAAGIEVVDDNFDETAEDDSRLDRETIVTKPARKAKAKTAQQSTGSVALSDIKKAASFANSVGGLDKAIALLQILKVAKDVQ